MNEWWEILSTFQKFFWFITIPATTFMILQTIMTAMGAGGDSDVDFDVDGDLDGDFEVDVEEGFRISMGIFSVRNLVAFFTFFGWTGILLSEGELDRLLILLFSVLAGVAAMMISFSLFYFMQKMTSDGSIKHRSAIGRTCIVYIPIPKLRTGIGKVSLVIQGGANELEAMTDEAEELSTNSLVKVIGIIDNRILLVKKVD